ncbi:MAG: GIY-YIG nuclease family protein [Gomphosphaeria aponina SAG 52.96 = DSM 107014]|uniref:GIY-YIG nuclease family protein n=1 Tax=Gomphosphaeria aponina SAG 52.96 = DSM 107014 TaxID=1521640 RepID=A0A941GWQ6_9CHRO|nr:GIY-YIG nuclease family protein [Gomphosphaeria aponina SAG 52.96 = DSM 107014]
MKITSLKNITEIPYLNEQGKLPEELQGKIGAYAVFNQEKELQFVGYSREIYLSLKQHLVRQPENCYWLKYQTITHPSRTILEEIRSSWIRENGTIPPGNSTEEAKWTQPIDAKLSMTEGEQATYNNSDELGKIKLLKQVARKVEAEIKESLKRRELQEDIRFNPKIKEQGLLDLQ